MPKHYRMSSLGQPVSLSQRIFQKPHQTTFSQAVLMEFEGSRTLSRYRSLSLKTCVIYNFTVSKFRAFPRASFLSCTPPAWEGVHCAIFKKADSLAAPWASELSTLYFHLKLPTFWKLDFPVASWVQNPGTPRWTTLLHLFLKNGYTLKFQPSLRFLLYLSFSCPFSSNPL